MNKEKFLKIAISDLLDSYIKYGEKYSKRLENYLEKNNFQFDLKNENYFVYIDKLRAIKLSLELGLKRIDFIDKSNFYSILTQEPSEQKPKNIVIQDGKKSTTNQFKKNVARKIRKTYITKNKILKRKILTEKQLEKALETGQLKIVQLKNKSYINRTELIKMITETQISNKY